MHVTWSVHLKCWWFKAFQRKNKVKRSDFGEIKLFSLPHLHIVVIMHKKLRHFFLAVKSLKQIIYLDSRDNFGPVCKNPDFVHFFFFSRICPPRIWPEQYSFRLSFFPSRHVYRNKKTTTATIIITVSQHRHAYYLVPSPYTSSRPFQHNK